MAAVDGGVVIFSGVNDAGALRRPLGHSKGPRRSLATVATQGPLALFLEETGEVQGVKLVAGITR